MHIGFCPTLNVTLTTLLRLDAPQMSDRRHRAFIQIGYMLRGRMAADLEAVRDMLRLVFESKRRESPSWNGKAKKSR